MKPNAPVSSLDLKQLNTGLVRQAIKEAGTATTRHLSDATGLSPMTVSTILHDLTQSGAVTKDDCIPSRGGRPSRLYRFNERYRLVLTVFTREIGGQNSVCVRIADLYGTVIDEEERPLEVLSLTDFEPFIDRYLTRYPQTGAIGFGLPGIECGGRIAVADYKKLVGGPLVEHFSNRYGIPVHFENDVNAAVLGYGLRDGAPETEVYLYFPWKYPPGAGIRTGGRLLKGHRNFAGEVGHLPLGIAWGTEEFLHHSSVRTAAVSRVVVSVISVIAPESVVLYGEFLTHASVREIRIRCEQHLPAEMVPDISLSGDFTGDFQRGLVYLTLQLVEPY